jgi:hypothetical protein
MDEMSAEEYRTKLQETISARQAKRREEAIKSGIIGNRSSNGYLDTLSGGPKGENNTDFEYEMQQTKWRSDSVSSWMDALKKVEREIESKLELMDDEEEFVSNGMETDNSAETKDAVSDVNVVDSSPTLVNQKDSDMRDEIFGRDEQQLALDTQSTLQPDSMQDEISGRDEQQQLAPDSQSVLQPDSMQDEISGRDEQQHAPDSQSALQPDSVIEFASTLKQSKAEKELSRKSEWQNQSTDTKLNDHASERAKSEAPTAPILAEETRWFYEKRQRPVPSSNPPEYLKVEKYVGDSSRQSKLSVSEQRLERGWYNEKRVRPIPNSDHGQRPTVSDRTGAQSERKSSHANDSIPLKKGVWYDEKRVRPAPNSDPAERPKISDRTGAQSQRKSSKASDSNPVSNGVWYNEKRVRPIPNSDPADRPTVSNRTGAQQNRQILRASDSKLPADEETWYDEKRVRPAPTSDSPERPKVADRTGAELELTKKSTKTSKASDSQKSTEEGTWYNEKRVRPTPNTVLRERPKVFDRTGAELDNTPKGPVRGSFLRSLLNADPPNRTKIAMQTSDKATKSDATMEK